MKQNNFMLRISTLIVVATLSVCSSTLIADEDAEREFTLKVLPILTDKCFGCHGSDPDDIKGDYSMLTRELLLRGGETEDPTVVPGKPDEGTMMGAITWEDLEMPPKENDRLTDEQIEFVRSWIKNGAPWPDEDKQKKFRDDEAMKIATADGMIMKTSGGTSEDWTNRRYQPEDLWAFQKLDRDAIAKIGIPSDADPIDFLVQKQMKAAASENAISITSAPKADPLTLIRRATFDLIGLPPTPEEVNAFQTAWENDSKAAWSELVDRLLASPHYGERWGQHWLDVARYADTAGYSNDYERSNMWRYRDYVIRSFNKDKPYNEFIVEQLAGDELWENQPEDEKNPELLVATSFLRMGAWDPAMTKQPEARQIYVDDVVNSVGQTFLATTLRCVKCHDHKFDPIPTKDYYRIYAAFAATQLAERPAPFLPEENQEGFEERKVIVKRLLDYAIEKKNELTDKRETAAREWYKENNLEYKSHNDRKDDDDEVKPPRHYGMDYTDEGQLKIREQDEWIWNRRLERYEPMVQSVYNGPDPRFLNARKLRMPGKVKADAEYVNFVFTGGSLEAHGEKVQPGVMSALGVPVEEKADDPYVISNDPNGRRLAVANWVANPENPLTARSMVNRVWQYHFGKPIAGNPNNFGVKGQKPTHPQLLDWMAIDLVDNGWTLKRLHKQIMLSNTYQMASSHPDQESLLNNDPNNDLLAYFPTRRLTAEEVRDAMLKVTGELNSTVGGLPVMPEINMEVALQPRMIQFSLAPAYYPSPTPEIRNRRSIYAYRVRGQADPFLEVFNQPNPNDSCEARDVAAVSPQAFTLMNSALMHDRAIAFALRLKEDSKTTATRVQEAFELALSRRPTEAESNRMVAYVERMEKYHDGVKPEPTTYPTKITRSVVEEFSGMPFEYEEILPIFEDYTPDKKASEVDAPTRALADLCLMLFNSNEFLYIY